VKALALGALLLGICTRSAAAQHATLGPDVAVAEYREVASSLRYSGVGPGASAHVTWHRFTLDAAIVSIQMKPASGSAATQSFRATEIDGWLRWDALDYVSFEVGLTQRSPGSDFAAQFSGGGTAPLALELGLGLGLELSRHLRAKVDYSFQRLDRKTNPAGGAEASVPIEQSLARLGLAVGL